MPCVADMLAARHIKCSGWAALLIMSLFLLFGTWSLEACDNQCLAQSTSLAIVSFALPVFLVLCLDMAPCLAGWHWGGPRRPCVIIHYWCLISALFSTIQTFHYSGGINYIMAQTDEMYDDYFHDVSSAYASTKSTIRQSAFITILGLLRAYQMSYVLEIHSTHSFAVPIQRILILLNLPTLLMASACHRFISKPTLAIE